MSVSALAASRLSSPSVSGVGAARPAYYKNLSDAGIAALSAAQIGAMQPVEMAALRTSQIGAFNPQALASGLLTYQNNTGEALPATVIPGLSGSQIGQFSKPLLQSVLPSLSTTQLGAITGPQIGALPSANLAALKPAQIAALNPSALASGLESYVSNKQVIPVKIIASLGSASISQFSGSLVNATMSKMSATQIGAINPASISGIGTAALQSLSGAQLSGFTQVQVTQASTSQIASLKPQQISALPTTWLNVLSSEQLQSLSNASIAALTTAQIAALDTDHVRYLSGAQVASLSKAQLGALNSNQIQAIDAPDISAMSTGQFSALSKMQLQALRVEQIAEVNVAKARTISAKNIASMSYEQIAAFTTPTVANLNGTQLAALTASQISQGLNAEKIAAFSPTQLSFFTGAQFQAMTNAEVAAISLNGVKKLSNIQLKSFTAAQFSHFTQSNVNWLVSSKFNIGFSAQQKDAINARKTLFDNNAAPTLANVIADQSATEGAAFTFIVPVNTFADVDSGDTLSYAATRADGSTLPSWLQFDSDIRTFSGTPGIADPGELNLRVTASDLSGATVSGAFKVTVGASNAIPTKAWTKLLGTSNDDEALAMTTGVDGSIYVSGSTKGSLDGQTNSGGADAFITKFNPNGTKQWTKLLGTGSEDVARAMTTGTDGSIYVSGSTEGSLDEQTNSSGSGAFITKFNPDGAKQWTQQLLGGSSYDKAAAMTTGVDGSIYVSGSAFGSLEGQAHSGGSDVFITKLNPNGTKQWTKLLGSSGHDFAEAVTTGTDGSIYVSGYTTGSLDGQTISGWVDAFITKFNPEGAKQWTQLLGSSESGEARAMTTGTDGSIYVSGVTGGSLDGQTNSGAGDAFITKFNPNGNKQWTKLLGTSAYDYGLGMTIGVDGSIYVSGITGGSLQDQANSGEYDAFIAKFNSDGTKQWTNLLGTSGWDMAEAVTTGTDGSIYVSGYVSGSLDGQINAGRADAFIVKYSV